MKWNLIFLFCLLSVLQIHAQDQLKIDSLLIKLNNAKEDTTRIKILLDLSDKYSRTDFLKALEHAKKALDISTHIENNTPTYDDAGTYTVTVDATDEFGNKNASSVVLTVKNVNRAPLVINPVENKDMMGTEMPVVSLSEIIADPDDEMLAYTVKSSNESVVKLFMADDAVIFTGKASGTSTITLTGTDAGGLIATHSFDITVLFTGIDESQAGNFSLYPNPTKGEFNLFLSQNLKTGSILQVTDLLGSVLYEVKPAVGENPVKLDISNLANGVYLVKVNNAGLIKTLQVIKN